MCIDGKDARVREQRRVEGRSWAQLLPASAGLCADPRYMLQACVLALSLLFGAMGSAHAQQPKPNVITIVLDDLSGLEFSRSYLPSIFARLVDHGTTFQNFTVNTPLCGPSRSSYHTGKLSHNHGFEVCPDKPGQAVWDKYYARGNTLVEGGPRFHALGYYTGMIGRYNANYGVAGMMNRAGLPEGYMPPGWDVWLASIGVAYVNWPLSDHGTIRTEPTYVTDYLTTRTIGAIDAAVAQGKPFFLNVWPPNPHYAEETIYAARHAGAWSTAVVPNASDLWANATGKHPGLVGLAPRDAAKTSYVNTQFRERLRSMAAVDEMVEAIAAHLDAIGQMANTIIILTSDNGYKLGHWRMTGKQDPYFRSVVVPFVARGPGILQQTRTEIVQPIDVLPTLLEFAGSSTTPDIDGQSAVTLLTSATASPWRRYGFIQHWNDGLLTWNVARGLFDFRYRVLTAPNWKYIKWEDGFEEYYANDRLNILNTFATLPESRRFNCAACSSVGGRVSASPVGTRRSDKRPDGARGVGPGEPREVQRQPAVKQHIP